jgi:hypothetical protein
LASSVSSQQATCSRGVALIVALLMLSLMSILGLGLVLAVSSDALINGYYSSYRASYYGADSGIKIVRQYMANQIVAQVSTAQCASWGAYNGTTHGCAAFPIGGTTTTGPSTLASTVQATLLSTFGASFVPLSGSSSDATSPDAQGALAASFKLTAASVTLSSPVSSPYGNGQCAVNSDICIYTYSYTLTTLARGPGTQQVTDTESGNFTVTVKATTGGTTPKFSYFGAFIGNFTLDQGVLVYGTYTGPQFTNGSWNFGHDGTYNFTGAVSQSGALVGYKFDDDNNWVNVAASSASDPNNNRTTIAPNLAAGPIVLNQPVAQMPANDFGQSWAVLNGNGVGVTTSPASSDMSVLQNVAGTSYSGAFGAGANGVYLPVSGVIGSTTNPPTLTGGGIYVEGAATSVTLTPGSAAGIETYTILQGNAVTVITTNIPNNQTTIGTCTVGGSCSATSTSVTGAKTITGVPHSNISGSSNGNPQTILYVDGNIGAGSGNNPTGLQGPAAAATSETAAAIQNGVQLSVVANGNINVVTNLLYEQEPVTTSVNGSVPIDSPVANMSSQTQVLGIFAGGNCTSGSCGILGLSSPYTDNNLEIDAAIAMVGKNCTSSSCGLETINQINNLTIVGGRAEGFAHSVSISNSTTLYDPRFNTGFGPPFFPSTAVGTGSPGTPSVTPTFQRMTWSTSPQN